MDNKEDMKKYKEILKQVKNQESMKRRQLIWFKKFWPEVNKCGFPCNELYRTRKLVNANLYKEAECLIKQHEKLQQQEAVVSQKEKISYEERFERDLKEKLENVRQLLGICKEDTKSEQDCQQQTTSDQPCQPCIRWRPGLYTSKLERFKLRQKRIEWNAPEDYACYDSEGSTLGWGCFDETLEQCFGFKHHPKPHQMRLLTYPNGSLPLDPKSLM